MTSAFEPISQGISEFCWNTSENICCPHIIVSYCSLFQCLGAVSCYFCLEGLCLPNEQYQSFLAFKSTLLRIKLRREEEFELIKLRSSEGAR